MSRKGKILIVDDNEHVRESLELLLKHDFKKVVSLESPSGILSLLRQDAFDLVLLDMNFSGGARDGREGLYWLKQIVSANPDVLVVLVTAFGGVELAVEGMKQGAVDFILKPWSPEKLIANLKNLIRMQASEKKLQRFQTHMQDTAKWPDGKAGGYVCSSPAMKVLYETISKVAVTDANVLITGENGTGKEGIARDLHNLSGRRQEVFAGVDLGALPGSLFESELFGHIKGSFTGAFYDRKGRFEIASGGTLFLDEIGNISPEMQVKLLSALEQREIVPVGGNRPVAVDVRLVAATNADIAAMVSRGTFRKDLFYRINTIHLHMPPLRERGEDIEGFCYFFLEHFSRKYRKQNLEISPRAMQKLLTYSWPGNVRELKHTIEKAVILSESSQLKPDDFFLRPTPVHTTNTSLSLQELEEQAIRTALRQHEGNLSQVARQLGITRATLYAKMKKYGI